MPCTPAKARHLFKGGLARPKRNKLGLFYVQLCYEQQPDNQPLAVGIDPGSSFEGFSVVGTRDTVLNLMVAAPDHVKEAVERRRHYAANTTLSQVATRHPLRQSAQPQEADTALDSQPMGGQGADRETAVCHAAHHRCRG